MPLVGGGVLMTLGLALRAVEAHWRGDFVVLARDRRGADRRVPRAAHVPHVARRLRRRGGRRRGVLRRATRGTRAGRCAALAALGDLVERTLQILINTLSFARVGAFALAHAGLSSAIVALMSAAESAIVAGVVLVVGNVVVLVLEGLVVSIQTTRLVLFEFFTRFLVAEGRVFHPLPPPPSLSQESSR